jgi:hypothetical protein
LKLLLAVCGMVLWMSGCSELVDVAGTLCCVGVSADVSICVIGEPCTFGSQLKAA